MPGWAAGRTQTFYAAVEESLVDADGAGQTPAPPPPPLELLLVLLVLLMLLLLKLLLLQVPAHRRRSRALTPSLRPCATPRTQHPVVFECPAVNPFCICIAPTSHGKRVPNSAPSRRRRWQSTSASW